ncbi:hypothetical protein, partial [Streptococcus anginosus]|uniref:hypothetical protein n=1 Tax=Streptococcus anginosus TaxID=1328 RepID=UPI003159E460
NSPSFLFYVATNCHSLLDTRALASTTKIGVLTKNFPFYEKLSFFVQLVAQVQYHHKKEGLILLSQ